jgi:hypothetical protein
LLNMFGDSIHWTRKKATEILYVIHSNSICTQIELLFFILKVAEIQ